MRSRTPVLSSTSPGLAWTVAIAVVALAAGAFTLSFAALRDLAAAAGIDHGLSFLWPLIVDGFIVVATLSAFSLRDRGPATTWYPWAALVLFAGLSVAGNALHMTTLPPELVTVPQWIAVVVSSVPAIALLIASHLLVVMLNDPSQNPPVAAVAAHEAEAEAVPVSQALAALELGDAADETPLPAVVDAAPAAPVDAPTPVELAPVQPMPPGPHIPWRAAAAEQRDGRAWGLDSAPESGSPMSVARDVAPEPAPLVVSGRAATPAEAADERVDDEAFELLPPEIVHEATGIREPVRARLSEDARRPREIVVSPLVSAPTAATEDSADAPSTPARETEVEHQPRELWRVPIFTKPTSVAVEPSVAAEGAGASTAAEPTAETVDAPTLAPAPTAAVAPLTAPALEGVLGQVVAHVEAGGDASSQAIAELLGVSTRTARRRLAEARQVRPGLFEGAQA